MPKLKQKITPDAVVSSEEVVSIKPVKFKVVKKADVKKFFVKASEKEVAKKAAVNVVTSDRTAVAKGKSKNNWRNNFGKKIGIAIAAIFILSLALATGYFYYQWRQTKTNPQGVAKDALSAVVAEVDDLIELPTGEEPTMATVTSVEKLKDQPFFANAQNGDKALIFSKAGKAILYRPSVNKIIEVISLVGANQLSGTQTPAQSPAQNATAETTPAPAAAQMTSAAETAKTGDVVIYNGTTQKGLAKSIATKIEEIAEAKVVKTGNAKGTFEKTVVIDLSGNNAELAQRIAQTVGGEVGNLPDGEAKPEADILIIGGSDFKN